MKAKSPKAKVWEVLSKNEKPFETPNHKYHSHTCTVTRKIVPVFVDDDIKIIEREKIINMHNVFMKETNNEYTEKHMNNLFNMLFRSFIWMVVSLNIEIICSIYYGEKSKRFTPLALSALINREDISKN